VIFQNKLPLDDRVKRNSENMAKAKRKSGFYDTCGKYLPILSGDKNPMKRED
jgi:hypothetical protein